MALSTAASAHPYDEVVLGAYLVIRPGELRLQLDVTPGVLVAQAVLRPIDTNADRRISDDEARGYAVAVLAQTSLKIDGRSAVWRLDRIEAPPFDDLELASGTIRIHAVTPTAAPPASATGTEPAVRNRNGPAGTAGRTGGTGAAGMNTWHTLAFANHYRPAPSQVTANVFLEPSDGWTFAVVDQQRSDDGRDFNVRYTAVHR